MSGIYENRILFLHLESMFKSSVSDTSLLIDRKISFELFLVFAVHIFEYDILPISNNFAKSIFFGVEQRTSTMSPWNIGQELQLDIPLNGSTI